MVRIAHEYRVDDLCVVCLPGLCGRRTTSSGALGHECVYSTGSTSRVYSQCTPHRTCGLHLAMPALHTLIPAFSFQVQGSGRLFQFYSVCNPMEDILQATWFWPMKSQEVVVGSCNRRVVW